MIKDKKETAKCPLCGQDNNCGVAAGGSGNACWCMKESFPPEIFDLIPPEQRGKSCICKACLDRFKQENRSGFNLNCDK